MKGVLLKILIAVLALSPLILVTGVAVGAPEASGEIIHIVKAGETLFALGRLYGVSPWAIARVNHLPNPDLIYVGQRLIIPVPQPPPPPPPPRRIDRGATPSTEPSPRLPPPPARHPS